MEKTWENFWTSGRVTDYLAYRNSVEKDRQGKNNGTVRKGDGDGFNGHACR